MTHTELETLPVTWSDDRDGAFFALVATVLPPAFVSGATALLMSYDDDGDVRPVAVARPARSQRLPGPLTAATGS